MYNYYLTYKDDIYNMYVKLFCSAEKAELFVIKKDFYFIIRIDNKCYR